MFDFFLVNYLFYCIRLILMYNIAIRITENHDKLPKIELKQGCYLTMELVLSIDISLSSDKQPSQVQTRIKWHIMY